MNTIIRIVNASGEGIYRQGQSKIRSIALDRYPGSSRMHPMPDQDSLLRESAPHLFGSFPLFRAPEFIFGFKDKEQLRRWFHDDDFIVMMGENDYKILVLSGEAYYGHTQAVINQDTMELLGEYPICEYLGVK